MSLEEKLIDRIDKFAADSGLNRSALIAVACVQYMDACEAAPGLNSLLASLAAFTQTVAEGKLNPGTEAYNNEVDKLTKQEADFKSQHKPPRAPEENRASGLTLLSRF